MHLNCVRRGRRGPLSPQLVDQPIPRTELRSLNIQDADRPLLERYQAKAAPPSAATTSKGPSSILNSIILPRNVRNAGAIIRPVTPQWRDLRSRATLN